MQSKYATLTALQNSVTNINNTINNEIANIQTEINNIEITSSQNVSKDLHYHTSHTDFLYQRNATNNDHRRQLVIQNHYFTYQSRCNTNNLELRYNLCSYINIKCKHRLMTYLHPIIHLIIMTQIV